MLAPIFAWISHQCLRRVSQQMSLQFSCRFLRVRNLQAPTCWALFLIRFYIRINFALPYIYIYIYIYIYYWYDVENWDLYGQECLLEQEPQKGYLLTEPEENRWIYDVTLEISYAKHFGNKLSIWVELSSLFSFSPQTPREAHCDADGSKIVNARRVSQIEG